MGIGFDAASQGEVTLDTSLTVSHTCSGADRVLYVAVTTYISAPSAGEVPTGVTYAGDAMEQLSTQLYGDNTSERITLFRLVNPDTGANNIVVSTTSSQEIVLIGVSLTGVNQTDPDDIPSSEANPYTQPSLDISSESGDLVIDFLGFFNGGAQTLTAGASQTERVHNDNTGVNESLASSTEPGSGTVTMSWTWSGFNESSGHIALNVNAASGADNLTASDISTGAPTFDSPTLGQTHALTASEIATGAPTLDTPILAIGVYNLTASEMATGAPTLDTPTIGQIHALTAIEIVTGAPTLDQSTIGQVHVLTANEIATGAPIFDTPTAADIGPGTDSLFASDLTGSAPTFDQPTIGQVHALTASEIVTGAPTLESATIGQVHGLTATEIATAAPTFDQPTLTETVALTASEIATSAPTLEQPTIGQIYALTAQDLYTGAPVYDSPTIAQIHALVAAELTLGTPTFDTSYIDAARVEDIIKVVGSFTQLVAVSGSFVQEYKVSGSFVREYKVSGQFSE